MNFRTSTLMLAAAGLSILAGSAFFPSPAQTWDAALILIKSGALWRATQDSLLAYLSGYIAAAAVANQGKKQA